MAFNKKMITLLIIHSVDFNLESLLRRAFNNIQLQVLPKCIVRRNFVVVLFLRLYPPHAFTA